MTPGQDRPGRPTAATPDDPAGAGEGLPGQAAQGAALRGGLIRLAPMVILPVYLGVVDQTIVSAALPDIAAKLGRVEYIFWIVVGYLVAATIAAPVYGLLGDHFGRRKLMLVALVIYLLASLSCALAPTMEMLVLGRLLQGLGGGGLITLSQALIGELAPPRARGRLQGNIAAIAVTSNAIGPVMGGYLTHHFGWETVFVVNLPIGLAALVIALRSKGRPGSGQRRRFDLPGLVYLSVFVAAVLIGFSRAPGLTAEALSQAGLLMALGLAALFLLLRRELRTEAPLIPVRLLRQPVFWRADALAACHGATFVSLLTFLPIYLRVVHEVSLDRAGLLLLPISAGVGVGAIFTGRAVTRTGLTAIFPSCGLAVASVLLIGIALSASSLDEGVLAGLLGLCALCLGTVMGVVQVTVQSAAGPGMLGVAAASVQLSRSIGAALGTGLVSLVLFGMLSAADAEVAGLFRRLLQEGPHLLESLSSGARAHLAEETSRAFVAAFLAIASFALTGTALAWSLPIRRV